MEFCGLCGLAAKNEKESNVLSKVNDAEIAHYTSWRHYRQVMEDGGLTGVIGKSLVPLGWYPSCLTLRGALQKGIYPTNTHYMRCGYMGLTIKGTIPRGTTFFPMKET